jgi:hypothetical protein
MRTDLGEAAGAHDQCSANAVGTAVLASQANAPDAGAQSPADAAGSNSVAAAGSASGAATGSGYGSSGMFAGNSSSSSSTGAGSNGSSASSAPSSSMPWTYDYMLFILPRQYNGWSYTEVCAPPSLFVVNCCYERKLHWKEHVSSCTQAHDGFSSVASGPAQ